MPPYFRQHLKAPGGVSEPYFDEYWCNICLGSLIHQSEIQSLENEMTVLISHTWHTFNDDVYSDVVVLKDEVHSQMLLISRGALFDAGDICVYKTHGTLAIMQSPLLQMRITFITIDTTKSLSLNASVKGCPGRSSPAGSRRCTSFARETVLYWDFSGFALDIWEETL